MNYYDEEIEIRSDEMDSPKSPKEHSEKAIESGPESGQKSPPNSANSKKITVKSLTADDSKVMKLQDSFESDSEISKSEEIRLPMERSISSGKWKNLNIPQEIKDIFQHILKYTPQNIDIEYTLQPFIPEYVPAVGDVDAFLKVSCPEAVNEDKKHETMNFIKKLGLLILDEPSGQQSDPSLLSMKLRNIFASNVNDNLPVIVPTARTPKDVQKWVTEIDQLHATNTFRSASDIQSNVDIDGLMSEWPTNFESTLNRFGLPSAEIECPLEQYVKILCPLFDIPLENNTQTKYISAIHTLFNLYLAVSNSYE